MGRARSGRRGRHPALVAAADAAASVYALEEAETHLRHALELVGPGTEPSTELSLLLSLFQLIVVVRGWGDTEVRRRRPGDVARRGRRVP